MKYRLRATSVSSDTLLMGIYQVYVTFATSSSPKFVAERRNEEEARRIAESYDDAKAIYILVNGTRRITIR